MTRAALTLALLFVVGVAQAQDRDGDHVPDAADLCPDVAETASTAMHGDGCLDVDGDGDGIGDDVDVCPATAETANGFEDRDGCPDADGAALRELAERIHFETGQHAIDGASLATVQRIAEILLAHAEIARVEIEGHADARGDAEANTLLSQQRASAVRDALVSRGVPDTRVTATGRGALPGDSPEIQAENRRCDIRVTLTSDPRRASVPTALVGRWNDGHVFDLDLQEAATSSALAVGPSAPAWLGPAGSACAVYAGRATGDRFVLHCRNTDREATIEARAIDADHLVGFIEVRAPDGPHHAAWTAARAAPFDQMRVVRMIQTRRSAIQACYERELRSQPTLAGRVAVQMTIEVSGAVDGVHVTDNSTGNPNVGDCVVRVIQGFAFDPGPIGGSITYTFPFVFEPLPAETAGLTQAQIARVRREHDPEILRCLARGAETQPELVGTIEVSVSVGSDGSVSGASVLRSTLSSLPLEQCLLSAIRSWRFDAPTGGEVRIVMPFGLDARRPR